MSPLRDDIIQWGRNAPLRRFLIVSNLMLCWIGCDLTLQTLSNVNMVGHDYWVAVHRATGIPWRQLFVHDWPLDPWRFHLYTAYSLPALGLVLLVLLDRLASQGETKLPRTVTWCGAAFIVGGAICDISVTVACSPDLAMEGNPYVRVLIDTQHPLTFVYAHALITQSLYITLFCGLWLGFLRHRQMIADAIASSAPVGWFDFLKAATGGAHLTTRQWLVPLRPSEVPHLYHYVWLVAIPVVFGISLFRWYAALEWLGVVEPAISTRTLVVLHGVLSSLVLYFLTMWRLSRPIEIR
jgi:hypothetical protein